MHMRFFSSYQAAPLGSFRRKIFPSINSRQSNDESIAPVEGKYDGGCFLPGSRRKYDELTRLCLVRLDTFLGIQDVSSLALWWHHRPQMSPPDLQLHRKWRSVENSRFSGNYSEVRRYGG